MHGTTNPKFIVYITLYGVSDVMIFGPFYKSCGVHCINF